MGALQRWLSPWEVKVTESILIVDDNSGIRTIVRRQLEARTRFLCAEAVDGLDAIAKASVLKPDLIILDLSMPRMNGLDAARVLRLMMDDVVIILFTSFADSIGDTDVAAAGISAVVSKDDVTALIEYVARVLPIAPRIANAAQVNVGH
jgi:two-component system response regulator NreC